MSKVCIILAAGGPKQNTHFLPSYDLCRAGIEHTLVLVHRNLGHVQRFGAVLLNKVINDVEIPHAAFGSYRFAYQTYAKDFDHFVFISDDVILRRDNWLKDIVDRLESHDKIGFGGSQIFNGGKRYPHPSHVRAPLWFAKTECLAKAKWEFDSDHDGEMKIGDQLTAAGYVGVQVGNKLNLGYDSYEENHITQLLERKFFNQKYLRDKFLPYEDPFIEVAKGDFSQCTITSPYGHIGTQNYITDLEPFDGLIYLPSLEIAKQHMKVVVNGKSYCI